MCGETGECVARLVRVGGLFVGCAEFLVSVVSLC